MHRSILAAARLSKLSSHRSAVDTELLCRANDMAVQVFNARDYATAFELYTEAIRLCPRKAIYHCNRAAAALKLGEVATAAEDARYSLRGFMLHAVRAALCTQFLLINECLALRCSQQRSLSRPHSVYTPRNESARFVRRPAQHLSEMLQHGLSGNCTAVKRLKLVNHLMM